VPFSGQGCYDWMMWWCFRCWIDLA
jgi:hypothetical protein